AGHGPQHRRRRGRRHRAELGSGERPPRRPLRVRVQPRGARLLLLRAQPVASGDARRRGAGRNANRDRRAQRTQCGDEALADTSPRHVSRRRRRRLAAAARHLRGSGKVCVAQVGRVARIRRVEPILVAQAFTACRGDSMRVLSCVVLAIGVAAAQSFAQASFLPIVDHIHLNVPDQAAAVAWYQKNFGGQPMTEAPDRVMLGDTRLIFLKKADAQPSSGSALDHIGFSFADVDAKVKELEAAGVKVVTPVRDVQGLFKLGFVEDPWGTRIELVQDAEELGLHHVHLRAPDTAATLAWYKDKFGGETGKLKDRIDGVRYGGVWLLAQRGDAVPSEGHAIDHFGFRTTNLDGAAKAFKAENVKFTTEPRPLKLASGTIVNYAYIEGPAGAKVELVQR